MANLTVMRMLLPSLTLTLIDLFNLYGYTQVNMIVTTVPNGNFRLITAGKIPF